MTQPTPSESATVPSGTPGPAVTEVTIDANGTAWTVAVEPRTTLAETLRERLGLTSCHLGCEHGVCGACTVTIDGAPVRACLMLAVQADGTTVGTVEGLGGPDGSLGPTQRGFLDAMSFQCGFCAPGIVVTTDAWLRERAGRGDPEPTDEEIRTMLAANLCRCTGYGPIVDGVRAAWRHLCSEAPSCSA